MQIDVDARYDYGLPFVRVMPHNADHSIPTPARVMGGVGPFDFSSIALASRSAIPIHWKVDNGAEQSDTIDLSGSACADITAVTLTELLAAITASSITALTCSKDSTTNRLKIALATATGVKSFQVYGAAVELAGVGQGYGIRYVKIDTAQSMADEPDFKADEEKSITDANGQDTSVKIPGYRKGSKLTIVDTAHDRRLRAIMTGGVYDETAKTFEEPGTTAEKPTFSVEYFWALYKKGSNKLADRVGYIRRLVRSCQGSSAKPDNHQGDMGKWTYEVNATSYLDESAVLHSDAIETELTVEEYDALDLADV